MNGKAQAVIADFGLAVYVNAYSREYSSVRGGNIRWMAPESLRSDGTPNPSARPTPMMDVWSFAHVCVEVESYVRTSEAVTLKYLQLYTDEDPYITHSSGDVSDRIKSSSPSPFSEPPLLSLPGLPSDSGRMPDLLWNVLMQCWRPAQERLTSTNVLEHLQPLTPKYRLP